MAFVGGVFSRLYNFVTDRNNGVHILAQKVDDELAGFATGLSSCILKDGTQVLTADIPWNGRKITGLGAATLGTDAMNRDTGDTRWVLASGETRTVNLGGLTLTAKLANAQLATMAANTLKANNTAGVAAPVDITVAQAKTMLGFANSGANSDITSITGLSTALAISQGGTGQTGQAAALAAILGASAVPIANGGTAATTATAAFGNLIAGSVVGIANGGTASSTAAGAFNNIVLAGTVPVANGGTGATSAAAARTNLGVSASGIVYGNSVGGTQNNSSALESFTTSFVAQGPSLFASGSCGFETDYTNNGIYNYLQLQLRDVTGGDTVVANSIETQVMTSAPSGAAGGFLHHLTAHLGVASLTIGRTYRIRVLTRSSVTPATVPITTRVIEVAGITA